MPFDHHTVDRYRFAGAHAQPVPGPHPLERDVFFRAAVAEASRHFRREEQQCLQGRGGAGARAELHDLPQQRERDDGGGSLEVHRELAVLAEGVRKEPGGKRGRQAVEERRAHAGADQCPHVRAAMAYRQHPALEQRSTCPHHHGRAEQELCCVQPPARYAGAEVPRHGKKYQQGREGQRSEKPAAHVPEFVVLHGVCCGQDGLQRHPAVRAEPWPRLEDLGVHRAGVSAACGRSRHGLR